MVFYFAEGMFKIKKCNKKYNTTSMMFSVCVHTRACVPER